MKNKKILVLLALTMLLILSLYACNNEKKEDTPDGKKTEENNQDISNEEKKDENKSSEKDTKENEQKEEEKSELNESIEKDIENDTTLAAPGYKIGVIPAIPMPIIPDLTVTEKPDAKISVNSAKNISSVDGITVTPVKIENGSIVNGGLSAFVDGSGGGSVVDENKILQSDGSGGGQYVDEKVIIQSDGKGGGNYVNNISQVSLQTSGDGSGLFTDSLNGISLSVSNDGSGLYSDSKKSISLSISEDGSASYSSENISITNDGKGGGTYINDDLGLSITNDGKGEATIVHETKGTITVEAEPLKPVEGFPKLSPVPAVPTIEANGILINLDSGVLFDVDMYNIRPDAHEILKKLAAILKEAQISEFQIYGHTDSDASDEHNQVLSENRANSVKEFLINEGVSANITTKGFGEKNPIATNETSEGKQLNRRVEIIIPTN